MINIDMIEDIEDESLSFYENLNCLIQAINEWDEELTLLRDYSTSIKTFLGGSLKRNKENINIFLKSKNPSKEAWKIESISVLLDLLDNNSELLDDVLSKLYLDIEKHISSDGAVQSL